MPLIRRIPKRGFNNTAFGTLPQRRERQANLNQFEDGAHVDEAALRSIGLANGTSHGIKILGTGELSKKLSVVSGERLQRLGEDQDRGQGQARWRFFTSGKSAAPKTAAPRQGLKIPEPRSATLLNTFARSLLQDSGAEVEDSFYAWPARRRPVCWAIISVSRRQS